MVAGQPDGGYTDVFKIIRRDCGEHPDRDYHASPELQRIRGAYPLTAGVEDYLKHSDQHRSWNKAEPVRPTAAQHQRRHVGRESTCSLSLSVGAGMH